MAARKLSADEKIILLSDFFNREQIQTNELARIFHRELGGVAAIRMYLPLLKNAKGENDIIIAKINEVIDLAYAGLREVYESFYERGVEKLGLGNMLFEKCDELSEKYNSKINLFARIPDELEINPELAVNIYEICVDAMCFLCLVNADEISGHITVEKNILTVSMYANQIETKLAKKKEPANHILRIRARLILLNARIMTRTDWKHEMMFKFTLEKPETVI